MLYILHYVLNYFIIILHLKKIICIINFKNIFYLNRGQFQYLTFVTLKWFLHRRSIHKRVRV